MKEHCQGKLLHFIIPVMEFTIVFNKYSVLLNIGIKISGDTIYLLRALKQVLLF
jgi:hypothetical protein